MTSAKLKPCLPFEKALTDRTGGQRKVLRREYLDTGSLPVVDQGARLIAGYTNDQNCRYSGSLPVLAFGDHTRIVKYVDFPFALGADGVKVLEPTQIYEPRFLYYYLLTQEIPSRGYSRHFQFLREIEFPLVVRSEQRRIAEILDHAHRLRRLRAEADVRAEQILPALFTKMFGDPVTNPMNWPVSPLKHLVRIQGGGTPSKTNPDYWNGKLPWASPKDMGHDLLRDTIDHITEDGLENSAARLIPRRSVLVVFRSGVLAHSFPVSLNEVELAINQDLKALIPSPSVLAEYLFGLLRAFPALPLACVKVGATVHNVSTGQFLELPVQVPPRTLQQRFASALDESLRLKDMARRAAGQLDRLHAILLQRAFDGSLTQSWRNDHLRELAREMETQARTLDLLPR